MIDEELIPDSPYRGLNPYREKDAPFFFGREVERENIISNLMGSRLTLLYGPTGVGKSSVLRAGVAYRLRLLANENLEKYGTPELAVVVFNKWYGKPLVTLHESIRKSVAGALKNEGVIRGESTTNLRLAIQTFSELVGGDLLIILDQFEEYFLYHGHSGEEDSFANELARAVNNSKLRVSFLISIREDALAKLDYFKDKIPNIFDNYLRIQPLSNSAAQEAIRKPLEVYSELTGVTPEFTIEDKLVDEVCKQVEIGSVLIGEAGHGAARPKADTAHVETSYLQLVMTRLWEEELTNNSHCLRFGTLWKLGGAANIVQTHLDIQITALPEEEQEVASEVFRYLVTPSGTKVTYKASDLAGYTKLPESLITSVLDKLCAGDIRIIRPFFTDKYNKREKNYEIFHDVLAPAILDWRAGFIRKKERTQIELEIRRRQDQERARLEEEARRRVIAEEKRLKTEQLKARRAFKRFIWVLIASAVITGVMFVLYLYAERQRQRALSAQGDLESQKAEAQKMLNLVNELDRSVPFFKAIMRGHSSAVINVNFSTDDKRIVTASEDGTARVWDVDTGKIIAILKGHTSQVNNAVFSPDGRLVATASSDNTARIWDAVTSETLYEFKGHTNEINDVQFSSDGKFIVTASRDGTARVWDIDTKQQILELKEHLGAVTHAAFSPNNQTILTASTDGRARVWSVQNGVLITVLSGHQNEINAARFSPNGRLVVTASSDGEARLWTVPAGQNIALFKGHSGPINDATFSPNGALIVTASDDKTASVWDARSGQLRINLKGHSAEVLSAKFSPNSTRIITASADNTARVWETDSGRILFELRGHINAVTNATFSSNSESAATSSEDSTSRTWDISGAGGIRITNVVVNALPNNYSGHCPVQVRFTARITAIGKGTIKYRFVRTNLKAGPEKSLVFESAGSKEVSVNWKFGGRRYPNPSGSFYLEIVSPEPYKSDEAAYTIRCQFPIRSEEKQVPTPTPSPSPVP